VRRLIASPLRETGKANSVFSQLVSCVWLMPRSLKISFEFFGGGLVKRRGPDVESKALASGAPTASRADGSWMLEPHTNLTSPSIRNRPV
jgi:hypothetical protein